MYLSWNIGTTSIFTSSNPLCSGPVGADVGIFVTDFQGITFRISMKSAPPGACRLAPMNNHCIGGSDLPLNSILSIDDVLTGAPFP